MAPATIYECHDETDETSVSNQTDTQPSEKKNQLLNMWISSQRGQLPKL